MPTVKSKRKRLKKEVHDGEEQGAGERLASSGDERCHARSAPGSLCPALLQELWRWRWRKGPTGAPAETL